MLILRQVSHTGSKFTFSILLLFLSDWSGFLLLFLQFENKQVLPYQPFCLTAIGIKNVHLIAGDS